MNVIICIKFISENMYTCSHLNGSDHGKRVWVHSESPKSGFPVILKRFQNSTTKGSIYHLPLQSKNIYRYISIR